MTDRDPVSDSDEHDEHDLHDRMLRAADTLVIDPARIRADAVRGGQRRRRARTGLAVAGIAAATVVVTLSVQTLGGRLLDLGGGDGGAGPAGTTPYAEGAPDLTGDPDDRAAIGNVTIRREAGGIFVAKGGLSPRSTSDSRIELWAGRSGEPLIQRDEYAPRAGLGVFGHEFDLAPGTWDIELRYSTGEDDRGTGTYSRTIILRDQAPAAER